MELVEAYIFAVKGKSTLSILFPTGRMIIYFSMFWDMWKIKWKMQDISSEF
jgi:hypothetical protein